MKNSKVVSFLSPFKFGQAGNLWTLPLKYRLTVAVTECSYRLTVFVTQIVTISTTKISTVKLLGGTKCTIISFKV